MNSTLGQRCASALMHPVTLAALGVLLVNDLLFKALWPGAWMPGKLSDLAWMMFAPPVLAYVLSWLTFRKPSVERAAFLAAYIGLPLLYAAFNTFAPVHDAILRVLGLIGGDGPRSPLDPTDSLVIPLAMAAALWVWRRRPLEPESIRLRLALLVVTAAALASVATSYDRDSGIIRLGRTDGGALGAMANALSTVEFYESVDGGLTWIEGNSFLPPEEQGWRERETEESSEAYFRVESPHIVREHAESMEVIYSYEHLQGSGSRWMQALDKRDVSERVITTRAYDLFYDEQTGNLIVAMGLQGVVVIDPEGLSTQVAVGRYSPTDFSFSNKVRTLFRSLFHGEAAESTRLAFLLAFSFATLALCSPGASAGAKYLFRFAAAVSAFLAISWGVYPFVFEEPWQSTQDYFYIVGTFALLFSGFGALPLLLVIGGMALARIGWRRLLAVLAASVGKLLLIAMGALVLFEAGPRIANVLAVMLVGLASWGLSAYQGRRQDR